MKISNSDNQQFKTQEKTEKIFTARAEGAHCPVRDIMARFGDKWSMYVILLLGGNEKLRFNELKSQITGISQRMLTVTLRSLEGDGLLTRTIYPEVPPKVEYQLTEMGHSLLKQLLALSDWAKQNTPQILEARERYAQKENTRLP
jgi:DNA-binding HxlR family transcriptional regulator